MFTPMNCANVHAAAAARWHRVENSSFPWHTRASILAGASAAAAHEWKVVNRRRSVARGTGEGGEGLSAFQLFLTISAVEARSNMGPGGGRYFIHRPPRTVDEIPTAPGARLDGTVAGGHAAEAYTAGSPTNDMARKVFQDSRFLGESLGHRLMYLRRRGGRCRGGEV